MGATYDLMRHFQGFDDRNVVVMRTDEAWGDWIQESGLTRAVRQAADSPYPGVQTGECAYASTTWEQADGNPVRMFTKRAFGPDLDVFGWFRVYDWHPDVRDHEGVKLYTGFEDNNANNTISLMRWGNPPAWYLEDRLGEYAKYDGTGGKPTGHNGDNQAVGPSFPADEDIRHRFLWRQRVTEDGALHGLLVVDGRTLLDYVSPEPLYRGRVGWRLDAAATDWAISVREH